MGHLNVEFKARYDDFVRARELLDSYGADFRGTDYQLDTYFKVPRGRLKLREGNIENSLIYYEREDSSAPKDSKVSLCELEPRSPIKEVLIKSLGINVVVEKIREIYFVDNVNTREKSLAFKLESLSVDFSRSSPNPSKPRLLSRSINPKGLVKFHLDEVRGLGRFLEVEAIDSAGDIGRDKLKEQADFWFNLFEINQQMLCSFSYSDMILSGHRFSTIHNK